MERGAWRGMGLTVVGDGVYPLVERGVELGDYVLLPLLADEAEERLRLVDRVLRAASQTMSALTTPTQRARPRDGSKGSEGEQRRRGRERKKETKRTIVRMANARI